MKKLFTAILMSLTLVGCTIVDTGKVGLRKNFDNTIESTERLPGSMNQTVVGSIIEFPVRDVSIQVDNLQPLSKEDSTMKGVDISVIYNINPSCVSDLYINKSKSFHSVGEDGDTNLMYEYIRLVARNAVYKVVRGYTAMTMNDHRVQIENAIRETMTETLVGEKLSNCILLSAVQVRSLLPSDALKKAADDLIRANVEKATKQVEVEIARKEAERVAVLSSNAESIAYMQAQAQMEIAKGIREGKVNTIVVPHDFRGIVQAGK